MSVLVWEPKRLESSLGELGTFTTQSRLTTVQVRMRSAEIRSTPHQSFYRAEFECRWR